jgi:hypothetical protein
MAANGGVIRIRILSCIYPTRDDDRATLARDARTAILSVFYKPSRI